MMRGEISEWNTKAIPGRSQVREIIFQNINGFETSEKKFAHFHIDGVSVSVILGAKCMTITKWQLAKRNKDDMMSQWYHQPTLVLLLVWQLDIHLLKRTMKIWRTRRYPSR
jgi:hypothetical protein